MQLHKMLMAALKSQPRIPAVPITLSLSPAQASLSLPVLSAGALGRGNSCLALLSNSPAKGPSRKISLLTCLNGKMMLFKKRVCVTVRKCENEKGSCVKSADLCWDSAGFHAAVTHVLEQHNPVPTALPGRSRGRQLVKGEKHI